MKVWVFAEAAGDKVTTATLELLTKAREIGSAVEAIYSGSGDTSAIAATVGAYGATKLHVIDPGDGLPGQVAAAGMAALLPEDLRRQLLRRGDSDWCCRYRCNKHHSRRIE